MSEPDVSVSGGDFFGRIPYASLIALLLCWLGAILFCVMAHQAIKTTVDQVRVPLGLADAVYYLERIQIGFVVLALVMLVVAGALIVFSFLATGTTRSRVYSGWRAKMGGRLAAVLCIMLAYVANLFWTFMLAVAAVFSFVYIVFEQLCAATRGNYDEDNCFDFTLFEPLFRTDKQLLLCGGEVEKFCALTSTASLWYYVAFFGALLVGLGLIHFIACLAANYVHIERGSKYEELNQIWNSEMAEMAPDLPPFHRRESPGRLGYRNVPDEPRMVTSSYKY